jgi:hypothetical protein
MTPIASLTEALRCRLQNSGAHRESPCNQRVCQGAVYRVYAREHMLQQLAKLDHLLQYTCESYFGGRDISPHDDALQARSRRVLVDSWCIHKPLGRGRFERCVKLLADWSTSLRELLARPRRAVHGRSVSRRLWPAHSRAVPVNPHLGFIWLYLAVPCCTLLRTALLQDCTGQRPIPTLSN